MQSDQHTVTHMTATLHKPEVAMTYEACGNLLYNSLHEVVAIFKDEEDCAFVARSLNANHDLSTFDFVSHQADSNR